MKYSLNGLCIDTTAEEMMSPNDFLFLNGVKLPQMLTQGSDGDEERSAMCFIGGDYGVWREASKMAEGQVQALVPWRRTGTQAENVRTNSVRSLDTSQRFAAST